MNQSDFKLFLERRLQLTENTLASKSAEYSTVEDKLHNFKRCSEMRRGKHPSEVLQGYMDKHLTSYFDMVDQIQQGKKFTRSYIDEKFGDIINYFILQEALFVELGLVD